MPFSPRSLDGTLSTRPQRFTHGRLPSPHLTGLSCLFPSRSPPGPLDPSSIRWFGPWPYSPSPRGPRLLAGRGRHPSLHLWGWGRLSTALRYDATIRLLSSLRHLVLGSSTTTALERRPRGLTG